MKKIVVGVRIDEHLRDKIQKLAKSEGKTISSYISEKIEDSISEAERIDFLVRNMYEEVLKLGDMLSHDGVQYRDICNHDQSYQHESLRSSVEGKQTKKRRCS